MNLKKSKTILSLACVAMLSTCNFSYAYDVQSSQLELFDSESTE